MNKKTVRPEVPEPAHPHERRESLPWETPGTPQTDPEGLEKLDAILSSPSYLPAIEDLAFLDGDDARGVRLQLDFLKPEKLLQQHGVQHTIVVFGSTRIVEPAAAQRKVDQARAAWTAQRRADPGKKPLL